MDLANARVHDSVTIDFSRAVLDIKCVWSLRYEINLTPVIMALGALQFWGVCGVDVRKTTFLNIEGRHAMGKLAFREMTSCVKLISYRNDHPLY